MPDRASPQERLRDLPHLDGGHEPGDQSPFLQGILEGKPVDRRREKPHLVARDTVDPLRSRRDPADDVPASEDDGDLDSETVDVTDLVGDPRDVLRLDAELPRPHQRLPRKLQENAAIGGGRHRVFYWLRRWLAPRQSPPAVRGSRRA